MSVEHLYIHWPFCANKCTYCDFISFEKHEEFIEQYHRALCNEIKHFLSQNSSSIKSIFLGGGTPSLYPLHLLKELFELLHKNCTISQDAEITIEVNPEGVEKKHLDCWKQLGINRLSIGVQLLDEKVLADLNRHQSNQSVKNLMALAKKSGFTNLSVDLILGLPGTTKARWFETLEYVISEQISHISVYFLTLYEKTPLWFKVENGDVVIPDEEWLISTYDETITFLEEKNFVQYEISNFAKLGFESVHNRAYWNRTPYRGFGLSAASLVKLGEQSGVPQTKHEFSAKCEKRIVNSNNLTEYTSYWNRANSCARRGDCDRAPRGIAWDEEVLSLDKIFLEELMLGLRQKSGVDLHRMLYFLEVLYSGENRGNIFRAKILELKKRGLLEEENGRVFLSTRGLILENEIVINLI